MGFGEDTIAVAHLLLPNHRIAYAAEAQVYHSHDYTLKEEFWRHYEMAIVRQKYRDLFTLGGSENQRGKEYCKALLKEIWKTQPMQTPYAFAQIFAKWSGYRLGQFFA